MTPADSGFLPRAWRFLKKPWLEKRRSVYLRWTNAFPNLALPMRLPFGAWWLVRGDHIGLPISEGKFENAEFNFINKFLQPGMTVLDIGAHHGFYTLLASKRVGPRGKVFSFEPSPRERKALLRHVKINRCRNVTVEGLALGSEDTNSELFVVQGTQTGCNSLRRPAADVTGTLSPAQVHVVRLDDWLASKNFGSVDFIKLDVEGGELEVLKGAEKLLNGRPRPMILVEVQDVRTLPWGYCAKEIITHLKNMGYQWFRTLPSGLVDELAATPDEIEGNFLACPGESILAIERLKREPSRVSKA